MKDKHKRLIQQKFPWWDHSYFLEIMETWLLNASYMHKAHGNHVGNDKVSRQMLIAATLCKRIREDDYKNPFWFGEVSIETDLFDIGKGNFPRTVKWVHKPSAKIFKHCQRKQAKQKQTDLVMLTSIINKNLFGWWD